MSRSRRSERLGHCPRCGEELGTVDVLISYEADDGQHHWADCPGCRDVVHPVAADD